MAFVQNFPFFSVILCMATGVLSSILPAKAARRATMLLTATVLAMSAATLAFTMRTGESYTYMMGHFPAPWGNELRVGVLECAMATGLSFIMLLSLWGGMEKITAQIEGKKQNLYFIMCDLMLAATLALLYTNDLFTAYVFVEIMTLASCGLIMARQNGRTLVASTKFMIISLLGSGLILIGVSLVYSITGHLLMENIRASLEALHATGEYSLPIMVVIALLTVGLAIKSALFPFHAWLPDAYGYANPASAALLSSLVSKAYIFLLIKLFTRMIGMDIILSGRICDVLFVFGCAGVVFGSIGALRQHELQRMIAYSSVAQIGYIFVGVGIGTETALVAALFQMLAHAAGKAMLFIAASGLLDVSGDSRHLHYLHGTGYRNVASGAAFTVGAMSMVGVPMLGGFIAKLYLSAAGMEAASPYQLIVQIVLALSTLLNGAYFFRTVIAIYRPAPAGTNPVAPTPLRLDGAYPASLLLFALLCVALGIASSPIIRVLRDGLLMFT